MNAIEELGEAISNAVCADEKAALSVITGAFVGLTLMLIRDAGHDPDNDDIKIDSQGGRDITIHKKVKS